MKKVTVYSRSGCHLCKIAIDKIKSVNSEIDFELEIKLIDDDKTLQEKYNDEVPVILIDDQVHDYWRIDVERFIKAIKS
jgi:glutaredoxin